MKKDKVTGVANRNTDFTASYRKGARVQAKVLFIGLAEV